MRSPDTAVEIIALHDSPAVALPRRLVASIKLTAVVLVVAALGLVASAVPVLYHQDLGPVRIWRM